MKLHVAFEELNSDIKAKFIETTCTFRTDFGELFVVRTNDVYKPAVLVNHQQVVAEIEIGLARVVVTE